MPQKDYPSARARRGFAARASSRANERKKDGQEAASAIVAFMELARLVHKRQYGSRHTGG